MNWTRRKQATEFQVCGEITAKDASLKFTKGKRILKNETVLKSWQDSGPLDLHSVV